MFEFNELYCVYIYKLAVTEYSEVAGFALNREYPNYISSCATEKRSMFLAHVHVYTC